ncbi:MAG: 6,7-dimethyl-8-ribityllumazine synthase [Acidobacteria bacterium]|nr:6,7-dimethyl-8-ribityllumazine synthase [Acidobacteriota bacterium]
MTPGNLESPKYRELAGDLTAAGLRFAIVVSRFNAFVTERLFNGALDALTRAGAKAADIDVARVPGALEIPLAAQHLAETGRYHAIICLGAVIRGETPHFEYVCAEASRGVAQATLRSGVPMSFGILTVENLEQAVDRAGLKSGNKGFEAALSAVEMANLLRKIAKPAAATGKRSRR